MNRKIREVRNDVMHRKSQWLPGMVAGIAVYVLYLVWPVFAAGIALGIAATLFYRTYLNPERELPERRL